MATDSPKIRVQVSAPLGMEIFLVDGAFNLVARGMSGLDTAVSPGIYRAKYRYGDVVREEIREVPRGKAAVKWSAPESLAVPKSDSSLTREERDGMLQAAVKAPPGVTGATGVLVVAPAKSEAVLELSDAGGKRVEFTTRVKGADPAWVALHAAVAPSDYILRERLVDGSYLCRAVVASAGWQVRALLPPSRNESSGAANADAPTADAARSTFSLARSGSAIYLDDRKLRLNETARIALTGGRHMVWQQLPDLRDMAFEKLENPMFGLFSLHGILRAGCVGPDGRWSAKEMGKDTSEMLNLLRGIVNGLRRLLGQHPDVEAAALQLDSTQNEQAAWKLGAPILRTSWDMLVEESLSAPALLPEHHPLVRIASGARYAGPWFLWHAIGFEIAPALASASPATMAELPLSDVSKEAWWPRLRSSKELQAKGLDDLEEQVYWATRRYVQQASGAQPSETSWTLRGAPVPLELHVGRRLRLPPQTVSRVLESIRQKVSAPPSKRTRKK